MNDEPKYSSFISSFTVNIIFVLLIITGAAFIPLLSLQLNPTRYLPSLTISWNWYETPARVVEQQVTSVIESGLTTITGIKKITSSTFNGGGRITAEFDKNVSLADKRFEVASLLRESHGRLPEGMSWPEIFLNMPSGSTSNSVLSFRLNGQSSTSYIYNIADEGIRPAISKVEGVYSVNIYGATPREWELTYDNQKLTAVHLSSSSLRAAISDYLLERELGGATVSSGKESDSRIYLTLKGNNSNDFSWDRIPVARSAGRIIYLTDVASVIQKDQKATSYFRINGLNTININVSTGRNVNTIKVAREVRETVNLLRKELPPGYSIMTSYDSTEYLSEEISKNIFRAVLSVILLLLFVLLISREFRYLLIISISLFANIFIAFIFYYLFRLEIHLYSLAGITVSFGIIINNTIVMTDHIRYRKNRNVGISLLAATLTTIGALTVIFFLPETSRVSLYDFAAVVIVNLAVSLAVALFFIPGLIEKISLRPVYNRLIIKRKRRVVRFTAVYKKNINFILNNKAILITAAILLFGLPVFLLPDKLPVSTDHRQKTEDLSQFQQFYNKTLGNEDYIQKIKPVINRFLGGTLRLFNEKMKNNMFRYYGGSAEDQRTTVNVSIGLSEDGLTIDDMNTTCEGLENMLSAYKEIEMFTTSIYNAENASISIVFKPEYDKTVFPYMLKVRIENYMNGIGSYHTTVYGIGKAFSNDVYSDYINTPYSVKMKGYNYDDLYKYSDELRTRLIKSGKGRIKEVFLLGEPEESYFMYGKRKVYRNMLSMDKYALAKNNSDINQAFGETDIYSRNTVLSGTVYVNGESDPLEIRSLQSQNYDLWYLKNLPLGSHAGTMMKMKDFTHVTREVTDNTIGREDQQYVITVGFDFIGNSELGNMILERNIDETNSLLPIGYTAKSSIYNFSWEESKSNYYLLFLVIIIIYVVCSVLLESLKQPFVVISLIPFSFIGLFLTFSVFDIPADEGAFAAMILLCGIVVNATLYILNDYNIIRRKRPLIPEREAYLKAFNGKIIPIFLTKLSTIIGLIPFLLNGKEERFWFALAAGTIGGLIFSLMGLFVFQPMMMKKGQRGLASLKSHAGLAGLLGPLIRSRSKSGQS